MSRPHDGPPSLRSAAPPQATLPRRLPDRTTLPARARAGPPRRRGCPPTAWAGNDAGCIPGRASGRGRTPRAPPAGALARRLRPRRARLLGARLRDVLLHPVVVPVHAVAPDVALLRNKTPSLHAFRARGMGGVAPRGAQGGVVGPWDAATRGGRGSAGGGGAGGRATRSNGMVAVPGARSSRPCFL